MKKLVSEFFRRGLIACGFGPVVLALLYLILHRYADLETLTVKQVCVGIFSISALAFLVGAVNAIYQIERLPLMAAILIHGGVLYGAYLGTYLLNDWLEMNTVAILVFSAIFVVGYLIIWSVIYGIIKRNTKRLNAILEQKRQIW
jgi:cytochrome c oxidase assembly factor CtaG